MALLVLFVLVFAVVHVLPAHAGVKETLKAQLGRGYGAAYGVLSLLLLAAMIWAYRQAEPGWIYDVPSWGRHANFALSLAGFICFGIFLFRGSWRDQLRYPMAIGVVLWAAGHLLANGDGKSLVLFGGLALSAIVHALVLARAGGTRIADIRKGHNFMSVIAGIALYGIMTQLHYAVTGMALVELR